MDQQSAIDALSALAQSSRMTIFRLLVTEGPEGLQVGEISKRLDIVSSTLSGHLAVLKRAGLLKACRRQREIHYSVNLDTVNALITFLLADCCRGRVENCEEILSLIANN